MIVEYKAISDVGCVRQGNEDMALVDRKFVRDETLRGVARVDDDSRFAAIVADGMGGNDGGELASDIAAQEFDSWLADLPEGLGNDDVKTMANDFARNIHDLINQRGSELEGFHGMGTTLTGVFHFQDSWYWINVGDSRVYIYRDGIMRQVTRDHSLRNLYNDPSQPSNVIYNAIGGGEEYECFADCDELPLFAADRLLICSDGLCDMLTDDEIESLLESHADAEVFVDAAKAAGGEDNISVIILDIDE